MKSSRSLTDSSCFRVYSLLVAISAVQLHRSIHGTRRSSQTVHLDRLIWVENWFDIASLAILLACIARLIVGTKMVVKQQGAKGYRIFIDVVTALVVILSFAGMIMRQIVWEKSFTGFNFEPNLLTSYSAIQTAVAGLLILGGLVNTVFAWVQAYAAKRQANGIYRGVGSFISAIATVFFVYILWTFVGTILFVVFTGPNDPTGWFFSDIFITRIAVLVIFYLIYKLGAKEENGLWLTSGHGTGVPKSSNEISLSQV